MLLLVVAALGAATWFAYPYLRPVEGRHGRDPVVGAVGCLCDCGSQEIWRCRPSAGFTDTPEVTDAKLQATALWRVLKRKFPDWYTQHLNKSVTLARASKDQAAIGQQMARKLVELRRQQVANALSATLPRLKSVATAFYDNLVQLRRYSYGRLLRVHIAR